MTRLDDSPVPDYANRLRLDDRRFVVIGAGQGIGRQTAHALAANGARLLCVDVDPDLAEDIAGEVGGTAWSGDATQRADVERYPIFKQQTFEAATAKESVDDIRGLTRARGEVRYLDAAPVARECADFKAALDESRAGFAETFLTAPSPGMVSAIVLNEHYASEEAFLAALSMTRK